MVMRMSPTGAPSSSNAQPAIAPIAGAASQTEGTSTDQRTRGGGGCPSLEAGCAASLPRSSVTRRNARSGAVICHDADVCIR